MEDGRLPLIYNHYVAEAVFVDVADITSSDGRALFVAVADGQPAWPQTCVSFRYEGGGTFHPGFLIVPETALLFIGAGEDLRCYDLEAKRRLWTDHTDCGFWGWARHGAYVAMSAELEFAVWSERGEKLWACFVEPPWSYAVDGDVVCLDIMGEVAWHRLSDGMAVV